MTNDNPEAISQIELQSYSKDFIKGVDTSVYIVPACARLLTFHFKIGIG
ncbi:hypothetical protein [Fischerella sp. PCC 9605]|nr:hypothetical protein [Fischerella sp. PCC 9605]